MSAARASVEADLVAARSKATADAEHIQDLNNQLDLACEDLYERNTKISEQDALIASKAAAVQQLKTAHDELRILAQHQDETMTTQIGMIRDLQATLDTHLLAHKVGSIPSLPLHGAQCLRSDARIRSPREGRA